MTDTLTIKGVEPTAATLEVPLLEVEDLVVQFPTDDGVLTAVDGVGLSVAAGEVVGVVGESGSGKSVTAMSIMGLLPLTAKIHRGSVRFKGIELTTLSKRRFRLLKGRELSVIFQDPMSSLNPVMTVGWQLREAIRAHKRGIRRAEADRIAVELLQSVGVSDPERRLKQYPHEFSGGMRQRVMIAMAMSNRPALVIADEPTTALDVTVQAQVMRVLTDPKVRAGAALMLITHDLGLIAERADRVVVMYAGKIVESGPVADIFRNPKHPYTAALLESLPRLEARSGKLLTIAGSPPGLTNRPSGCSFRPRCRLSQGREACFTVPPLVEAEEGHSSACHFADEMVNDGGGAAND